MRKGTEAAMRRLTSVVLVHSQVLQGSQSDSAFGAALAHI